MRCPPNFWKFARLSRTSCAWHPLSPNFPSEHVHLKGVGSRDIWLCLSDPIPTLSSFPHRLHARTAQPDARQSRTVRRLTYPDDKLESPKRVGCHSLLPVEEVQECDWEGQIKSSVALLKMEKTIDIYKDKLGDPTLGIDSLRCRRRAVWLTVACYRDEDQAQHCD